MDAFHIEKGNYGDVELNNLTVVFAGRAPGNFWKGNHTAAGYLDERATPKQRQALEAILSGKAGGPFALIAGLVSKNLGAKYVPIRFDYNSLSVSIPGIMEYQLKPTEGGVKGKPIQLVNNPFAPAIDPLNLGIGVKSWYKDHGLEFNNTGKDGNYAKFTFSGP